MRGRSGRWYEIQDFCRGSPMWLPGLLEREDDHIGSPLLTKQHLRQFAAKMLGHFTPGADHLKDL